MENSKTEKKLGVIPLAALVVSAMIGGGIFRQCLVSHLCHNVIKEGAKRGAARRRIALVITRINKDQILFGNAHRILSAHTAEGKAAVFGAPDLVSVAVVHGQFKAV